MSGFSDFHILTAIILMLFAIVFGLLYYSARRHRFSAWISLAYLAALIAFLLDATRTTSTPMAVLFIATAMFWLFSLAIAKAIYVRCDAKFPIAVAGLALVPATGGLIWLSFVEPDIFARSMLANAVAGLFLSFSLHPLWKTGKARIDGALFGVIGAVAAAFVARVAIFYFLLGQSLSEQSYAQSTYVWIFQLTNGIAALALAIVLLFAAGHDMVQHFYSQSSRDPLTGLLNRRGLKGLFKAQRDQSRDAIFVRSIILFDIDHFKLVNDEFGHAAGDQVLQRIAKTALSMCQEYGAVARTGGEEFAILTNWIPVESSQALAQHICDSLRFLAHPELGPSQKVTASFGLAVLTDTDTLVDGMNRADQALYRAKRNGRNQVALAKAA